MDFPVGLCQQTPSACPPYPSHLRAHAGAMQPSVSGLLSLLSDHHHAIPAVPISPVVVNCPQAVLAGIDSTNPASRGTDCRRSSRPHTTDPEVVSEMEPRVQQCNLHNEQPASNTPEFSPFRRCVCVFFLFPFRQFVPPPPPGKTKRARRMQKKVCTKRRYAKHVNCGPTARADLGRGPPTPNHGGWAEATADKQI